MENTTLMTLQEALVWLAGPLGIVAWGIFLSNFLRNAREADVSEEGNPTAHKFGQWLKKLSPLAYQWLGFGLLAVPPLVAFVLINLVPQEVLESLNAWYQLIAEIAGAYFLQQIWYRMRRES